MHRMEKPRSSSCSSEEAAAAPFNTTFEVILVKRSRQRNGSNGGLLNNLWRNTKTRRFQLNGQLLQYFDPSSGRCKGEINIKNATCTKLTSTDSSAAAAAGEKSHVLRLLTVRTAQPEEIFLSSDSEKLIERCVQIFNAASRDSQWAVHHPELLLDGLNEGSSSSNTAKDSSGLHLNPLAGIPLTSSSIRQMSAPLDADSPDVKVMCLTQTQGQQQSLQQRKQTWHADSDDDSIVQELGQQPQQEINEFIKVDFETFSESNESLPADASAELKHEEEELSNPLIAARVGNLSLLKQLGMVNDVDQWEESICAEAALYGHIDCLRYAHESNCPWDQTVCENACRSGSLVCLQYAEEHGCSLGHACTEAARHGQLECLQYAHEHGGAWSEETYHHAAMNGHLDCIKYIHQNGCPYDVGACASAAMGDHLDCLQFFQQHHFPWNERTCSIAAQFGHLECLRFAHKNNCPWEDQLVCYHAASGGHLHCLQYAHQNGCTLNAEVAAISARGGHLECLKYLKKQKCPWDEQTCIAAAAVGSLECLRFAHEHGCHWNEMVLFAAAEHGHVDCLKYAHTHGLPLIFKRLWDHADAVICDYLELHHCPKF